MCAVISSHISTHPVMDSIHLETVFYNPYFLWAVCIMYKDIIWNSCVFQCAQANNNRILLHFERMRLNVWAHTNEVCIVGCCLIYCSMFSTFVCTAFSILVEMKVFWLYVRCFPSYNQCPDRERDAKQQSKTKTKEKKIEMEINLCGFQQCVDPLYRGRSVNAITVAIRFVSRSPVAFDRRQKCWFIFMMRMCWCAYCQLDLFCCVDDYEFYLSS